MRAASRSKESFASPALQALTDRETDVLQRIALAGQIGSSNPKMIALNEELRAVRAQIATETHKLGVSLERDVDSATAQGCLVGSGRRLRAG